MSDEEHPVDQEQKPRERSFVSELVPDWRPKREQVLWAVRIILVLVVLLGILTLVGLPFDTTLWDWLDLLIIPVVLALGGYLFTRSENQRNREIADQRRQDEMLQAYLDGMSQLLTDKDRPLHRAQLGDSLSTVARARTLTVLTRLDGERKGSVVRFLYESGLITKDHRVLHLSQADLKEAQLFHADLKWADLSGADLFGANLSFAILTRANLGGANLFGADLRWAFLFGTELSGSDLWLARRKASLSGANLSGARGFSNEELERQAYSLEGATMPNGQKYEDWLNDREGRKEDAEND